MSLKGCVWGLSMLLWFLESMWAWIIPRGTGSASLSSCWQWSDSSRPLPVGSMPHTNSLLGECPCMVAVDDRGMLNGTAMFGIVARWCSSASVGSICLSLTTCSDAYSTSSVGDVPYGILVRTRGLPDWISVRGRVAYNHQHHCENGVCKAARTSHIS